jgi:hypothetical protein
MTILIVVSNLLLLSDSSSSCYSFIHCSRAILILHTTMTTIISVQVFLLFRSYFFFLHLFIEEPQSRRVGDEIELLQASPLDSTHIWLRTAQQWQQWLMPSRCRPLCSQQTRAAVAAADNVIKLPTPTPVHCRSPIYWTGRGSKSRPTPTPIYIIYHCTQEWTNVVLTQTFNNRETNKKKDRRWALLLVVLQLGWWCWWCTA